MSVSTSNEIKVTVTPWSIEEGFGLMKLHLYESLGGSIAKGDIEFVITSFKDQNTFDKLTEENVGEIRIKDLRNNGLEYKIPIFITSRYWKITSFFISFVCISDVKFLTDKHIQSFDNISDAINFLYPGQQKDIRVEPDSTLLKQEIIQPISTDYEMCTKLCKAYRKNTIFCYGWEGLMIKELCGEYNSFGVCDKIDPIKPSILVTSIEMGELYPTAFNYNKLLNYEPSEIGGFSSQFSTGVLGYSDYMIQRSGYEGFSDNMLYNERLMDGALHVTETIKGIYMPKYKIGDVITYLVSEPKLPKSPFYGFLCYSNEFFYSIPGASEDSDETGFRVSWESRLIGLERGTWAGEVQENSEESR